MVNSVCCVVAEAGVNHNGSEELALRLVDIAADAGADAIKFQTFRTDKLVRAGAPKADYQIKNTGEGDQSSMLRALELSESAYRAVVDKCAQRGIEFMSTPFDTDSADFLISLGVKRIKVPSGELTNQPFIEYLATFDLPLIVSTGMATLDEVREAVAWIESVREARGLETPLGDIVTLLHCTSNYPAAPVDINLRAMQTLAKACNLPIGYSDHSKGIAIATAAVALGATVVEKHFTSDRRLAGPDHKASLEPHELQALVLAIRTVEAALGDGVKAPRPAEFPVRDVVRRSVTAIRDLPAMHRLTAADVAMLRPGTGIPPKSLGAVIGRALARKVPAGASLRWEDFV